MTSFPALIKSSLLKCVCRTSVYKMHFNTNFFFIFTFRNFCIKSLFKGCNKSKSCFHVTSVTNIYIYSCFSLCKQQIWFINRITAFISNIKLKTERASPLLLEGVFLHLHSISKLEISCLRVMLNNYFMQVLLLGWSIVIHYYQLN